MYLMKLILTIHAQSKQFLPKPQHRYCTNNAEYEVGEIALTQQFYIQEVADKGSGVTAYDANDKVHTASFALTTHNAVGNVANKNTCQYRPSREICNMF